jgi:hypothetical protein
VYSLPPAVVARALNAGGRDWLKSRATARRAPPREFE